MSVNTPSDQWQADEVIRTLPRLLTEGTRALRKAQNAKVYIPMEPEEEVDEWNDRIGRSVIYPFFKRAVSRAIGSVLAKPIILGEDVPPAIRGSRKDARDGYWENLDLEGHDGNMYFSRVLEDAVGESGVSHTLVDFPQVGEARTQADLQRVRARPYCRHIRHADIIDYEMERVGGAPRFRWVRIRDSEVRDSKRFDQVFEIHAGQAGNANQEDRVVTWKMWEKPADEKDEEKAWEVASEGTMTPHVDIPLATLGINTASRMQGVTPFEDLAHLNIWHTQQLSDTGESIRVSCGAQLHRAGIDPDIAKEQRAVGSKRLLVSPSQNATAEWLERSGTAATVALEAIDKLERRMDALSNEPHIRRIGSETATGRAIDATEARTEVQAWAVALRDHVEEVLRLMAKYDGIDAGGSADVSIPPAMAHRGVEGITTLIAMHEKTGVPTLATLLEQAKAEGLLPDDLDSQAEAETVQSVGGDVAAQRTYARRVAALVAEGVSLEEALDRADAE